VLGWSNNEYQPTADERLTCLETLGGGACSCAGANATSTATLMATCAAPLTVPVPTWLLLVLFATPDDSASGVLDQNSEQEAVGKNMTPQQVYNVQQAEAYREKLHGMVGAVGVILEDPAQLACTCYVELSLKPAALVGATAGGVAGFLWLALFSVVAGIANALFKLVEGWHRWKRGNPADMSGDDPSFQYTDKDAFKEKATKELLFKTLTPKLPNTRELVLFNLGLNADDGERIGKDVLPFFTNLKLLHLGNNEGLGDEVMAAIMKGLASGGAAMEMLVLEYTFEGDVQNAAHLLNEPRGEHRTTATMKRTHGRELAARVARGLRAAADRSGGDAGRAGGCRAFGRPRPAKGDDYGRNLRLEHFPHGVLVDEDGGSLTMTKCTSTGQHIDVEEGSRLIMEDCRIFGCYYSMKCGGKMKASRCTFEYGEDVTLYILEQGSGVFVDCAFRKNRRDGVFVYGGKVTLQGGIISENGRYGVAAWSGAKVTVATGEKDKHAQTVCKDNTGHDWDTDGAGAGRRGVITGIPAERMIV